MRNKGLAMFGVFALVLLSLSIVSADSANNFSLSVASNGGLSSEVFAGETYTVTVLFENNNSNYTNGVDVSFSGSGFTLLTNGVAIMSTKNLEFDLTVPASEDFGSFSKTLNVEVVNASNVSQKVVDLSVVFTSNVPEVSFCEEEGFSEVGDLDIYAFDISNNGEGDDDVWYLLDGTIEIEVEVKNTHGDDSISDVRVELMILDESGSDVTDDFDIDDSELKMGKLSDRERDTVTFIINEIPMNLDEGDYRIYVRVYSDDDEETQCRSVDNKLSANDYGSSDYYAEIEVKNNFEEGIIITESFLETLPVVCGQENVELSFDVHNMGTSKEKRVLVQLYDYELGIDERVIINNFGSEDKELITFFFDVPNELSKNSYHLDIITYWDWDSDYSEDNLAAYEEDSDADLDEGDYGVRLDVLSCVVPAPIMSPELVSDEFIVGDEIVVNVVVSNPSNKEDDFVVSIYGYESWAELVGVESTTLSLAAGKSAEVVFTLKSSEAGIENIFGLRVVSSDNDVSQTYSRTIFEEPGFFDFKSIGGGDLTYWIAGVLVVLILFLFILILTVALKRRG